MALNLWQCDILQQTHLFWHYQYHILDTQYKRLLHCFISSNTLWTFETFNIKQCTLNIEWKDRFYIRINMFMIIRYFKYAILKESNVYFSIWNRNRTLWKDTNTVWKFSWEFSEKWQAQWFVMYIVVYEAKLHIWNP